MKFSTGQEEEFKREALDSSVLIFFFKTHNKEQSFSKYEIQF